MAAGSSVERARELKSEIRSSRLHRVWDVGKFFYRTGLATAVAYTLTQIESGIIDHPVNALPPIVIVGGLAAAINAVRSANDVGARNSTIRSAHNELLELTYGDTQPYQPEAAHEVPAIEAGAV